MTTELATVEEEATEEAAPQPIEFGTVSFHGKDIGGVEVPYSRLAMDDHSRLYLLEIVAPTQNVKQVRALLTGSAGRFQVTGSGGQGARLRKPGYEPYEGYRGKDPRNMTLCGEGYECYSAKIDYGHAVAMFLSKSPGFMKIVSPESLWAELKDSRFTTPIVPEWLPYIDEQLRDTGLLSMCYSYRCAVGVLTATTTDLDGIVEKGLSSGRISVPDPRVIDVEFRPA